jgi:hypothetical protein
LLTLALTAIASLPLFFLAYYNAAIGRLVSHIWLLSSAVSLLWAYARSSGNLRRNSIYICLLILGGLTVFQAFFLFSFNATSTFYAANYTFHPAIWSTDNQIPPTTAHLLANGSVATHWPFGSWAISDRTPLLAALLYPAAVVTRDTSLPLRLSSANESMILQICGFGVLNSWIVAVWAILRRVRFKPEQCIVALLLLAATPFVFFNSVYIWPKLLAATFCLIQYFYLDTPIDRPWHDCGHGRAIVSGIAAGLAIMSHSGIVLAVPAIFLIVALRSPARWLHLAVASAVTGVLIFPWVVWSTIAVPTSKALPKFFLTGSFGFLTPTEGVLHATLRTYRAMSFSQWFNLKLAALSTLSGWRHDDARELLRQFGDPLAGLGAIRAYQFFFLLPTVGLLFVPLIWLLVAYARKQVTTFGTQVVIGDLTKACLLTVFLQILIMMPSHLLPTYPYFVPLTLQLLAVIGIIASGSFILRMIGFLNYLLFIVFWIISAVITTPVASFGALLCALGLIGLASFLIIKMLFNNTLSHQFRVQING